MRRLFASLLAERRTVRARLMLWNIAALAIILILLGGFIQYTFRTRLVASIDADLKVRAERRPPPPGWAMSADPARIKYPFAPVPFDGSALPPPRERNDAATSSEAAYLPRIMPLPGEPKFTMSESSPWDKRAFERAAKGHDTTTTAWVDGASVRVFSKPITYRGRVVAVIQVPYPLTEVNRAIAGMNGALLTMIPVALALAGLGGAFLTQRALRPVGELAHAASHIGAQELSRRLPVIGDDEFSHLTTTFNQMLNRLDVTFTQREQLVTQLEQSIERERRFTADASHELKTPLTVIRANTSMLLQARPSDEDYWEMMQDVDCAARDMSRLVQDLLLLARYDEGRSGQKTSDLAVRDLLQEARRRVSNPADLPILIDINNDSLAVAGEGDQLARLFSNLLENAVRYTTCGGEVRVTAQGENGNVVVRVADSGIGIAAEHLPRLGERFYRVDVSRYRPGGGTGLGLSICKDIVAAHKGFLSIQSSEGKGTTVSVTLPRAYSGD